MSIPSDRQYSKEHEWVVIDDDVATVGITDYAQDSLGDVVYTELPQVGDQVVAGEVCGEIESTKSVSDLYSPVSGTISEVNTELGQSPEIVNDDPYGQGWLFKVTITELGELLDAADYAAHIGG